MATPAVAVPGRDRFDGIVPATIVMCLLGALLAALGAASPDALRLAFFVAIASVLVPLALWRPLSAVFATLVYLAVMALLRRLLIFDAPWSPFDPMLLVGPLVAGVLLVRLFVLESRSVMPDVLSKLVFAMLGLTVLQIVNPTGGGIAGGLGGFLYVGVPLLWFFVGRELLDEAGFVQLLKLIVAVAVAVAAYGLWQIWVGFPVWDEEWIAIASPAGLQSLDVDGVIRGFATFSSFLEYALVLASGVAVAATYAMRGRPAALLALPLLAVALFFSSSRAPLITAVLAVAVMAALRPRRLVVGAVVVVVALAGAFGAVKLVGSSAGSSAGGLVDHQVRGLANPLDASDSTLVLHFSLVVDGVKTGLSRPLGSGTGSTNQAGSKLGGVDTGAAPSEIDFSNAFLGLGLPGGLLFLVIVGTTFVLAVRGFLAGDDLLLPAIGLLVVSLGQWLSGGHWFLAPVLWLVVGRVAAVTADRRAGVGRAAPA